MPKSDGSSADDDASHWKSAVDPRSGRTYYYHEVTRETQWRKPLELASSEERRAMEEKERRQKEFFAAMESNILNSLSKGVVPGTPNPQPLLRKKSSIKTLQTSAGTPMPARRKSSRSRKASFGRERISKAPTTPGDGDGAERPNLVRTISAMDETVLSDLIRRQPSFRAIKKESLNPNSLSRRMSTPLNPLEESASEFADGEDIVFDPFDGLPDEDPGAGYYGDGFEDEDYDDDDDDGFEDGSERSEDSLGNLPIGSARSHRSSKSHGSAFSSMGGRMNESSISGFGLTWEETQALKQLAKISQEMVDVEDDDIRAVERKLSKTVLSSEGAKPGGSAAPSTSTSTAASSGANTPAFMSGGKDSKNKRDLPIELELDDDESDTDSDPSIDLQPKKPSSASFGKGDKPRPLPRELEFDDSDSEPESDLEQSPYPTEKRKSVRIAETAKKEESKAVRPNITRRNTCGTLYVGTTMSAPDKDATIKCVCGVYRAHILSSEQDFTAKQQLSDKHNIFNDHESEQKEDQDTSSESSPAYTIPSLDEVAKFYRDIFVKAQMEADCIIMSLIYVERLVKITNGDLRPRASNWRSLLFSCMVLSSKVWDDLSMWNADFSQSCPPGVSFPLQRINELELAILNVLSFQVKVPASEYAKYYFLLRSMLIKSGLGGDQITTLNPLDVVGALRLQQLSSQFEAESMTKASATRFLNNRSKSLGVADRQRVSNKQNPPNKINLEQVVKM